MNDAPRAALFRIAMVPPCASTMRFEILRPQTVAAGFLGPRAIHAKEGLEDIRHVALGDAWTVIGDADDNAVAVLSGRDFDCTTVRQGVLDRVLDEIAQDHAHLLRIDFDWHLSRWPASPAVNAGTSMASQAYWHVEDVEAEVAELKARGVVAAVEKVSLRDPRPLRLYRALTPGPLPHARVHAREAGAQPHDPAVVNAAVAAPATT
jgi:hypothetical protein